MVSAAQKQHQKKRLNERKKYYWHKGQKGLSDTKCPLQRCRHWDTFEHMIQFYDLVSDVRCVPGAVDFLIKMARKTQIVNLAESRVYQREANEENAGDCGTS